jgi:N-acetylglucosaminyl-diphospho-decaprenol L-rhamnosyltransferase
MRIAAIVVAHNSAADLPRSLGCLSPLGLHRVVVADNASTDDSAEVAGRYTRHVLALLNVGFGAAVNAAADAVPDVDAYLLLNPDCAIGPDSFARLVDALRADGRLAAVGPVMRYPDGRYGISSGPDPSMAKEWLAALRVDRLVPRRLAAAAARSSWLRRRVRLLGYVAAQPASGVHEADWLSGFCLLVRAVAFRDAGGFDPRFFLYFEDVDLCRRLRQRGWSVGTVAASVADHTESTATKVAGKTRLYRTGMSVYFSKHGTRTQRLLARVLRTLPI